MNSKPLTKRQRIHTLVIVFPFISAITLLIIGLFTLDDTHLEGGFRISFEAVATLLLVHAITIILLARFDKFEFNLPKTLTKKILSALLLFIMIFISSLLLEMGLRMNLNNWLKNKNVEKIKLTVVDKYVSRGKHNDYYVVFNSGNEELKNRVGRSNFERFSIGEEYEASVNKGYFDGYFLTTPMKQIKTKE